MPITLSGDGITSDNITSLAASKLTGQVPDANAPSGSVIQVVQGVQLNYQSYASPNNDNFTDVSGFNVSITPSSTSSRILVMLSTTVGNERMYLRLVRDTGVGVVIAVGSLTGSSQQGTVFNSALGGSSVSYQFVDSPNTTSATTYKVQVGGESGKTFYIGASFGVGSSSHITSPSTIIAMEIAV